MPLIENIIAVKQSGSSLGFPPAGDSISTRVAGLYKINPATLAKLKEVLD